MFRWAARFQIPIPIREAHHRVRVANIDPLRIRPRRIEVDAKRLIKAGGKNLRLLGLAVGGDSAKDANVARLAFGDEKIAIGRGADQAGIVESGRVLLHFEAGRNLRPRVLRTRHNFRAIA